MGCTLSQRQQQLLEKHFREVILLMDGDKAGRTAGAATADDPLPFGAASQSVAAHLGHGKRFAIIGERVSAQFRFEAFNIFNTPIRNAPNNDPNSTQFGFVSVNQGNFPRQIQLGFKLPF
jgi:hypothetical protein